jgi:hypothetical protein
MLVRGVSVRPRAPIRLGPVVGEGVREGVVMRGWLASGELCGREPVVGLRASGCRDGRPGWVRLWWACVVVAGVWLSAWGFGVMSAFGSTGHGFVSSVSEAGGGSLLGRPDALAVDGASGDVFVGDPASGVVDVYSPSGSFLAEFGGGLLSPVGVAVDEASGLVFVADSFADAVLVYGSDGSGGYVLVSRWFGEATTGKEFGQVTGVAVDNSGGVSGEDVYVVDGRDPVSREGVVDVFEPSAAEGGEGVLIRVLAAGKMQEPNGVAVSPSTGRVLVADSAKGGLYAYSAQGAFEEKLNGKGSPYGSFVKEAGVGDVAGVAVDGGSGDIYVAEAERHAVSQYGASGEWEGWITSTPSGDLGEPVDVALSGGGDVFVADAALGVVDRFGGGVVVPGVVTGKVAKSSLTRTSAALAGTVNGEGKVAKYKFQYGETQGLGSQTPVQGSGGGEEKVAVTLEGLHAGRAYFYRLVAENENGSDRGAIREFLTLPAVEGVSTGPVEDLLPESVTLTGTMIPGGADAHYRFQWGATRQYGQETPLAPGTDAGSGIEPVGASTTVGGLGANTTYHYRIVAENGFGVTYGQAQSFTTPGPPRIESEPSTGIGHEEATVHARIDPDGLATSYRVQYGETTSYGSEAPGSSIGSGSEPVAVSVTLKELQLGVTYHYRVVAKNEAATTYGPDQIVTTLAVASIDQTYATGVSAGAATLHAEINPLGHDTHYYFQYGTQDCQVRPSACTDIPAAPGEDIGEGETDWEGSQVLAGLEANTTYYYCVLVSNSLGTSEGRERTFTTALQALPDERVWEMVTPPDKGGAPVEALTREGGWILASEHGDALTYVVDGALGQEAQGNRSPEAQQVLATRTASGWISQDIATPSPSAQGVTPGQAPEYQFFTPDLASALVEPVGQKPEPPLAQGVTQATMYLRDNATGTYLPLVTEANTAPGTKFGGGVTFVSATPDLSHVVLASRVALTGAGSAPGLYEWFAGQLQLASVLPDGRPAKGLVELGYNHTAAGGISNHGARLVWTVVEEESEAKLGHLYLRDVTKGETAQIDAAQGVAEPKGAGTARFQSASSDGSRIFFTDKQRLTADSTAEPQGNEQHGEADLYECEVVVRQNGRPGCKLKDLTVDAHEGQHADVEGAVLATSQDGSTLYLVAKGVLAVHGNGNGETAQAGKNNLYELHYDGTEWSTLFVATLAGQDSPEWEANGIANTAYLPARVSPNGRYLAFMSAAPITGFDNVDASAAAEGARDEEVYLYDSATASLRCVSCDPSGVRPTGVLDRVEAGEGLGLVADRREIWLGHWLAGNLPGWTAQSLTSALVQSRYLSDEGRLYFDSPADLVPAASNGKEDVYQYEPSGVGGCQSVTGGCVSLISAGSSDHESAFMEATPDGSNVFFITAARLLPQDTDTAFDIYDARECTASSPCLSLPRGEEAGCDETDTCRPAIPAEQIPTGPAGSAIASGPGNAVMPAAPAKQQVQARKAVRPLTRKQKLARALRSCRKRHPHSKKRRAECERNARRRYAFKPKPNGKAKRRAKSGGTSSARRGRSGR